MITVPLGRLAMRSAKRLRPADVVTHRRVELPGPKLQTLADLLALTVQPLAQTVHGTTAFATAAFARDAQRVLGARMLDIEARRAPPLTVAEIEKLRALRALWRQHLDGASHALVRQPPSSGGETARWSLCTSLWLLVCHANYLMMLSGLGGDELAQFDPSASGYLCRNRLVVTHGAVLQYSLRALDLALDTWLAALDSLDAFEPDYVLYMLALEHRFGALVCTAGSLAAGFDAPECAAPASGHEAITGEYFAQSYWRFTALRNYAHVYDVTGQALVQQGGALVSVPIRRPAASLAWAPSARAVFRLREFVYDVVFTRMSIVDYEHSLRSFVRQFEPLPGDAEIYRMLRQTHMAIPRSVLEFTYLHRSTIGTEYVRNTKYTRPVLEWVHEEANFRAGDASVRSEARTRIAFHRQLATLQVVHSYVASTWGIEFRKRFVLIHRSPDFFAMEQRARGNGWPYIVQQFGFWTVVVPHRVPPERDVFVLERSHPSEIARRDAETTRRLADEMRRDEQDDDDSSYSYEYEYESDGGDVADLRVEMARLNIEAEEDERGAAFALERTRTYGQRPAPPEPSVEAYLRAYDCATFLEAFALWCAALLRINGGMVDDRPLAEFITAIFDWQLRASAER